MQRWAHCKLAPRAGGAIAAVGPSAACLDGTALLQTGLDVQSAAAVRSKRAQARAWPPPHGYRQHHHHAIILLAVIVGLCFVGMIGFCTFSRPVEDAKVVTTSPWRLLHMQEKTQNGGIGSEGDCSLNSQSCASSSGYVRYEMHSLPGEQTDLSPPLTERATAMRPSPGAKKFMNFNVLEQQQQQHLLQQHRQVAMTIGPEQNEPVPGGSVRVQFPRPKRFQKLDSSGTSTPTRTASLHRKSVTFSPWRDERLISTSSTLEAGSATDLSVPMKQKHNDIRNVRNL